MAVHLSNPKHCLRKEMIDTIRNSGFGSFFLPSLKCLLQLCDDLRSSTWSGVEFLADVAVGSIFCGRIVLILFGLISIMLPWIVYFPSLVYSISLRLICWVWPSAALAKLLFNSVIRYVLPSLTSLHYRIITPSCCCKSCWLEFSQPHSESEMRQIKAQLGLQTEVCFTACVFYSLNELVSHHQHAGLIRQHVRVQWGLRGDCHLGTGALFMGYEATAPPGPKKLFPWDSPELILPKVWVKAWFTHTQIHRALSRLTGIAVCSALVDQSRKALFQNPLFQF